MEIREQTADRLVIYSQPLSIGLFLSIFLAIPLYILIWGSQISWGDELTPLPVQIRWLMIPLLLVVGWVFYTSVAVITCSLDRTTKTVTIEQQYLLSKTTITRSLTEITKVEIKPADTEGTPIHPIFLHFSTGDKYPVYSSLGLLNTFNNKWFQEQQDVAKAIQKILDQ